MKSIFGFLLLASFASSFVHAQTVSGDTQQTEVEQSISADKRTVQPPLAPQAENKNVEKLEVTGSYIKRIDIEGPSPIVTIDSEVFAQSGTNTINDMIQESAYFQGSQSEGDRAGAFTFHGQHGGNSLVLLNGLRIPKMGAPGRDFFNGLKALPTNVVERVEILKDGASATYGSDAMSGVINFVTKKDYDGAEFSSRINVPEQGIGLEQNYSATFGKNFSRGNWFTTVQYIDQQGYTEADLGSFYREPRASAASNFSFKQKGKTVAEQSGSCNGEPCDIDYFPVDQVRSPKQNVSALATGRIDLSSSTNATVLAMYNRRQNSNSTVPSVFLNRNSQQLQSVDLNKIKSGSLAKTFSDNGASGDAEFEAEPLTEVGLQTSNRTENSYTLQSKVEGYYLDSWSWSIEGAAGYQEEQTIYGSGLLDRRVVKESLENNAWDPTNPQPGALNSALVYPQELYASQAFNSRMLTSGELFDFQDLWGAGGVLAMAVGVDAQWEASQSLNDPRFASGVLNTTRAANLEGSRRVTSAFTEFSAYPIKSIELQLAGRFDSYSDFGNVFNPKFAVAFRPSDKILFRGSWGTNFHAPSVNNMIFQETLGFERVRDNLRANNGERNVTSFIPVYRYRDPNIGAETATNINFGTVIQPNKAWTFKVDYWNFSGQDTIAKVFGGNYTFFEDLFNKAGTPELLADLGVSIERDDEGKIVSMRAPEVVNQGQLDIRGIDFEIDTRQKIQVFGLPMNVGLSSSHSHIISRKQQRASILPVRNRPDLEWKNTTTAFLHSGKSFYRLAARTTAGDTGLTDNLPTYTEWDLTYTLASSWGGNFSLGVKNLLNSNPPIRRGEQQVAIALGSANGAFNPFSPLRRRYFVGYSQSF